MMTAESRHKRRAKCDHICLLEADHNDGYHMYGYQLPSPRRYDRMREWRVGRLRILWGG